MRFENELESLELLITRYELPEGEYDPDGDDKNSLVLRCSWRDVDGDLHKDSNACLLTYELQEMTTGLKVLCAGVKQVYESDFLSPYFSLSGVAEGEDRFRLWVSFYLPDTMDGNDTAELEVTMSKSELKAIVEELDRMCAKFPDRT